ncbi:OmpH family outer membrane protein [Peristeroidobacter soli]|uniref:OmpH family outer membrane protein n=1 Tax=Peristeroidobacter soli TaxID=2497877 RepID=UPI0013007FC7|nr:OmpH family outer membrane protein [Peristeroidobacter soli]
MYKSLCHFPYVLTLSLVSTAVLAADPAPAISATATPEGLGGPAIPGACLLSREAVLTNAKVGQAATARLQELTNQAQEQVNAERQPIDKEIEALKVQAKKLSADEARNREQSLAAKLEPIRVRADQLSREIEATRVKVVERISMEAQPIIATVYKEKGCGLLIDRNIVLGGNFSNDLTAAIVSKLDQKITTISFDREVLPAKTASATP